VTGAAIEDGGAPRRDRPSGATATRLGLLVSVLLLLTPGTPPITWVLAALVLGVALTVSLLRPTPVLAVAALLFVGVMLRSAPPAGFSDVLVVTSAAAREMLAGGHPYGHGFDVSTPPGAPFAYGPLALLWYLPSLEAPGRLELLASLVVLVALAVRGRVLGLAVFAAMPALVVAATDGSNDSTAGLLILAALLAAVRAPLAGAVLLALATAFKPYALAWLPALIAYAGGIGPLLAFLMAGLVAWLPAMLLWSGEAIAWSLRRADEVHDLPYYSLAYALRDRLPLDRDTWGVLRFAAGAALAAATWPFVRTARSFIIAGALVFLATLFLGWWSTFAYLAALAPVICWHLDDWLDLGDGRAVWPGDPVAAVTAWVDSHWPVRHPDRRSTTRTTTAAAR
jgi:hypothetical protein